MQEFFKRIKIRAKLLLAFGSIILLSVLLTLYAIHSISRIIALEKLNEESQKLSISLERIELAAKEFIFEGYKEKVFQETGRSKVINRFESAQAAAHENLHQIVASKFIDDLETRHLVSGLVESAAITNGFQEVKNLLKKRGFKDYGLEGSLRKAIHKIENSSYKYDRSSMLMLRRHEKDFFLRKDLKYQQEFNSAIVGFAGMLKREGNTDLLALLTDYQKEFNQVVEIEKELGLTNTTGKKGKLFADLEFVRQSIGAIQGNVQTITASEIAHSKLLLLVIFLVQVLTATLLALTYSNALTSVIKEIRFTMGQLAEGVFPPSLKVQTTEEIGQTKIAINQFLERLKVATVFAEKLGSGQLTAQYDNRFGNDVLANALVTMQHKLVETEAIQAKINWNNEGAARFSEILKHETEDIRLLGDKILKLLVEYLHANQAALYIINREESCMECVSTYAYGKKKFVDAKIDLGTGLIGQCVIEQESIYLKEIPKDYIKITSGLGEATPRNVLIVPLKGMEDINGVLELASFTLLEEHHIRFVEKIAENIASILSNHESSRQTKALLAESQRRAYELAQQEEEMRQNAEELQATQEELERQRKELHREINDLKARLRARENHAEFDYQ